MRKAALHNLGCKVNAYETEAMQQLLEAHGYEIVPFEEKADVYIINTCTVTNIADRKSRQMLHRAKKRNPDAAVVAAGCYVQAAHESLKEDLAVDILIGNNKKQDLIGILDAFFEARDEEKTVQALTDISREAVYEPLRISGTSEHTRAYIKVQDGCNQFCSYCIIPYARGRVRSRALSDILSEIRDLSQAGYREVVLTGIHLSSYGIDFAKAQGEKDYLTFGSGQLLTLIESVAEIDGIERIRLGSLEPRIITEAFTERLSRVDKLCPHFHLSLQSGCDSTLQRMNRHYTTEEYMEKCRILRKYFLHPALTTDIIVGFPGETGEEFAKTEQFVDSVDFFETHIFKYSARKGTRAAEMKDQVREEVKNERSGRLIALSSQKEQLYREWFFGKEAELLVEEARMVDGQLWQIGHTREYVKAGIRDTKDRNNEIIRGIVGETIFFL